MAGLSSSTPPPSYGDHVSILSIDGGGIRGIIPASVLDYLDKALKVQDLFIFVLLVLQRILL